MLTRGRHKCQTCNVYTGKRYGEYQPHETWCSDMREQQALDMGREARTVAALEHVLLKKRESLDAMKNLLAIMESA